MRKIINYKYYLVLGTAALMSHHTQAAGVFKFPKKIRDFNYFINSEMLSKALAKEVCSCHFSSNGYFSASQCLKRNHVPEDKATLFVKIIVDDKSKSVSVVRNDDPEAKRTLTRLLIPHNNSPDKVVATYEEGLGCQLVYNSTEDN